MTSTRRLKIAVLASGGGTNLQAMLDRSREGSLRADVVAVFSDNPEAFALTRARRAGVPCGTVAYGPIRPAADGTDLPLPEIDYGTLEQRQRILSGGDRENRIARLKRLVRAEHELIGMLELHRPDYICLAGYMRLLSPYFLDHFNQGGRLRVVNIHPALLPAFPGQHGYRDTFEYGCKWGGVTVHFVDEGEDSGPVISQAVYPIWPEDELDTVQERGLALEYEVYSQALNWLAAGQVKIEARSGARSRVVITDPDYRAITACWLALATGKGSR
jgi:phosphoribosylglycinamide formyltransferase-1